MEQPTGNKTKTLKKIKQEIIDVKAEKGGRTTTKKREIKTRVWKTSLHRKARSDNRKLLSSQETQSSVGDYYSWEPGTKGVNDSKVICFFAPVKQGAWF